MCSFIVPVPGKIEGYVEFLLRKVKFYDSKSDKFVVLLNHDIFGVFEAVRSFVFHWNQFVHSMND